MKENKLALKLLKELKEKTQNNGELRRLSIIEKDLEVSEIIKKKGVNVGLIKICDDLEEYNRIKLPKENKLLTQTEFNLIKEWLGR